MGNSMKLIDERNADILIYINGELLPRNEAKISVFDSAVQGGDAVWEGLRVYNGRIAALNDHLQRLQNSAKALMFKDVPSTEEVKEALFKTLEANGMWDQTHVRLTLTRGEKITSGMNPSLNQSGCTLIVLAEWKPPVYSNSGIKVITSSIRRNSPHFLDSKIHHNNLLNNILAIIEANVSGVDSAIMLDNNGFISETNDTIGIAFNAYWIANDFVTSSVETLPPIEDMITSFEWALNPDGNTSTYYDVPDVINNSWRWYNEMDTFQCSGYAVELMNVIEAAGIANIFSAGNNN